MPKACCATPVPYRMLLLGEIASALPDDLRDHYPDVAWRQIRAFRNLAIHKYFGVDWAVVWKIAQEEPLVLEKQVLAIISAEYPELAQTYGPGPAPEPGTASLRGRGDTADLGQHRELPSPRPPELGRPSTTSVRGARTTSAERRTTQRPGTDNLAGIPPPAARRGSTGA